MLITAVSTSFFIGSFMLPEPKLVTNKVAV